MGDISANHSSISECRNPTFYYIGTLDPLGKPRTGALQTSELLDSTRDLIVFSDAITRHFHVVKSCLAQNDQDTLNP